MINVSKESNFFQNISKGNYLAVLNELNESPMMLEMISSPNCLLATPILIAAYFGQVAIFELLKQRGANINSLDAISNNLLKYAVASNNDQMIIKTIACFNKIEFAKAIISKNAYNENVLEFALRNHLDKVDLLLGNRVAQQTSELPVGSATKGKAAELRSSSHLTESDDGFQDLINAFNELTKSQPLEENHSMKLLKELSQENPQEETEIVHILNAYEDKMKNQAEKRLKKQDEKEAPTKSSEKYRIMPVSHPILSQLKHHTKLLTCIQVKVQQANEAKSAQTNYFASTPG